MISSTGHFDGAIRDLTEKTRTTCYMLRKSLLKYNPPIKLWLNFRFTTETNTTTLGVKFGEQNIKTNWSHGVKATPKLFHLEFCKNILGVNRSCPNIACRAELGRYPLLFDIQKRATKFWHHLQIS